MQNNINSHPSSEVLAQFIDNELNEAKREEIVKHLIECDECSDVVAMVKKYGMEKKTEKIEELEPINNINYRLRAIVLSGLVASLVIFLVMPSSDEPFINFYTNQNITFKSVTKKEDIKDKEAKNREINEFLYKLVKTVDMSYINEFNQAEKEFKSKHFKKARELYQIALNQVEDNNLNREEKSKQRIVINYRILLLSMAEKDSESVNEYKDIIKDDIRRLKEKGIE